MLPRRTFCQSMMLTSLFGSIPTLQAGQETVPNIVLITADDLGTEIGCYGDDTVATPHLDQLAKDGILFENAYVTSASCSPSRSSIFTGLYPHENGQIGLSHRGYSMKPGLPNLPVSLKKAGYYTGVVGKVHVAPAGDIPFDFNSNKEIKGSATKDVLLVDEYVSTFFEDKPQKPFFLMVNYFDPHHDAGANNTYVQHQIKGIPEETVDAEDVEPFPFLKRKSGRALEQLPGYYNCIKRLDAGVGLLMDQLKRRGLEENTIVLFLGDHGAPFPGGKLTCYEAGVRVPYLMKWPKKWKGGQTISEFVSTVDIYPTLMDLIGQPVPEVTGRSYKPLIENRPVDWRDYMFTEFNAHTKWIYKPQRAVRDKRYKLILHLKPPQKVQLFDLQNDPHEFENVADKPDYQAVRVRLLNALKQWRNATNDPLLDLEELKRQIEIHEKYAEARNK